MEAFAQSESELHSTLEIYGNEFEFLVATDPDVRQSLLGRMRPVRGRGVKSAPKVTPVRQLLSSASPALKEQLAR